MNITGINVYIRMFDNWPGIDWFIIIYRVEKVYIGKVPEDVINVICCNNCGPIPSSCFCKMKKTWWFWLNTDVGDFFFIYFNSAPPKPPKSQRQDQNDQKAWKIPWIPTFLNE